MSDQLAEDRLVVSRPAEAQARTGRFGRAVVEPATAAGSAIKALPFGSARQASADALGMLLAGVVAAGVLGVELGLWSVLFSATTLVALAARGTYASRLEHSAFDALFVHVGPAVMIATAITVTLEAFLASTVSPWGVLGMATTTAVAVTGTQMAGTLRRRRDYRAGLGVTRTLVVGSGHVGRRLAQRLIARPDLGFVPVGYLDDDLAPITLEPGREDAVLPVLGSIEDFERIAEAHAVDAVVIAFMQASDHHLASLATQAHARGIRVLAVPRLFDAVNVRAERGRIGTFPMDELTSVNPKAPSFRLKYAIDRLLGCVAVLWLAPVLAVLAVAVKVTSPGPVFFRQRRVGLDGREFDILKFRSMRVAEASVAFEVAAGSAPGGVEGEDRRTPIGKLLRRTNLDELPQLINIARGEMSIVGPRPERPEFVAQFSEELRGYDARHRMKAGLTGWAQVNGLRGQTSILERAEWDNYYIENWSLRFDAMIVARTVKTFFENNE